MGTKLIFLVLNLILVLPFACASNKQNITTLEHQNTVLNAELAESRIQLAKRVQEVKSLEAELKNLKIIASKCSKNFSDVQTQIAYLKNINQQLTQNVKRLSLDLEKKRSVIQLQEKVIRLLDDTKKTIEHSLKNQVAAQDIEIVEMEDKLKVVFIDKILFDSGSIEISEKGKDLLLVVAESIRDFKNHSIVVEGHTDNVPLRSSLKDRFASNWELSTARAATVVRFLQEKGRLQPERLSARGYSYFQPVASNRTNEGRRQNRRIEIILGPPQ